MPTTLTLKNIPDELYGVLKQSAQTHRRSLNSEVIVCLETLLLPQKLSADDRLTRARQLRQTLSPGPFSADAITAARDAGRP